MSKFLAQDADGIHNKTGTLIRIRDDKPVNSLAVTDRIRKDLEGGCFRFEGEIDVLRNPEDDLGQPMFAQGIRGKTDRVVYKFRKVAAE